MYMTSQGRTREKVKRKGKKDLLRDEKVILKDDMCLKRRMNSWRKDSSSNLLTKFYSSFPRLKSHGVNLLYFLDRYRTLINPVWSKTSQETSNFSEWVYLKSNRFKRKVDRRMLIVFKYIRDYISERWYMSGFTVIIIENSYSYIK